MRLKTRKRLVKKGGTNALNFTSEVLTPTKNHWRNWEQSKRKKTQQLWYFKRSEPIERTGMNECKRKFCVLNTRCVLRGYPQWNMQNLLLIKQQKRVKSWVNITKMQKILFDYMSYTLNTVQACEYINSFDRLTGQSNSITDSSLIVSTGAAGVSFRFLLNFSPLWETESNSAINTINTCKRKIYKI